MSEPVHQLEGIPDAIRRLQRSSRRAVPLTIIGLLSTIAAAAVAIYYIFNLSAQLEETREKLNATEETLRFARSRVDSMTRALSASSRGTPTRNREGIDAALAELQATQQSLASASESIEEASEALPTETAPSSDRWFVVLASYPTTGGVEQAQRHLARAQAAGICASIWETAISSHFAVVFGPPMEREAARATAERARSQGLAADAFAQRDSGWRLVRRAAACREEHDDAASSETGGP